MGRKFQKDPPKVPQIQVGGRGSMVKPMSQFWISQIGLGLGFRKLWDNVLNPTPFLSDGIPTDIKC